MDEKLYNEIVITKDSWKDKIAEKLGNIIITLTKEGEVCKVYDDDDGIYIIQHNHNEDKDYWGCPVCTWLTEEENDSIIANREYEKNHIDDEDNSKNEPTFGTVAAEFYFETSQLLKQYKNNEMSAEDTLEKIIYILNKAEEAEND